MVDGFKIKGKTPLNGVIRVSGAKNAALPINNSNISFKRRIYIKKMCQILET